MRTPIRRVRAGPREPNRLARIALIGAPGAADAERAIVVVAAEVGPMAERTAKAADPMAAQIGTIRTDIRKVIDAIAEIGGTVGETNACAIESAQRVQAA